MTHESQAPLQSSFRFGESEFAEKILNLRACDGVPFGDMVLPGNPPCQTPKGHFPNVTSNPEQNHLKTAGLFRLRCVLFLAAIPISSTY